MTKEEFHAWTVDAWFVRGSSDREHPATFPLEIPRRLIKLYTFPGEVVVDPFMGSGTTGQACAATGREFIGVDREPRFYEIARRRIEAASQSDRFTGGAA